MFKSFYHKTKNQLDKIFPRKVQETTFLISFIIMIIALVLTTFNSSKDNKAFFKLELNEKVDSIVLEEDGYHYKINKEWYKIKNEIVNYISVGDSILKKANSFEIMIKESNKVKWNSKVNKNIIFYEISSSNHK